MMTSADYSEKLMKIFPFRQEFLQFDLKKHSQSFFEKKNTNFENLGKQDKIIKKNVKKIDEKKNNFLEFLNCVF